MIKLFTHLDLDGVSCAVLARLTFSENVDITYCNYDEVDTLVREYITKMDKSHDTCFITDISIKDDLASVIDNDYKNNFKLFDHHKTALELNKYDWCTVKTENNDTGLMTSGTELFSKYLIDHKYLDVDVSDFVRIITDYDTWRWSTLGKTGLVSKDVNDLMYIYGRERFETWCIRCIESGRFPRFDQESSLMLSFNRNEIEKYIKEKDKTIIVKCNGEYMYGVVFADKYISELGNELCKLNRELDYIAIVNMSTRSVSYRTIKDDIDMVMIAKKYGGGGHPKAAGSKFDVYKLARFLDGLLD